MFFLDTLYKQPKKVVIALFSFIHRKYWTKKMSGNYFVKELSGWWKSWVGNCPVGVMSRRSNVLLPLAAFVHVTNNLWKLTWMAAPSLNSGFARSFMPPVLNIIVLQPWITFFILAIFICFICRSEHYLVCAPNASQLWRL